MSSYENDYGRPGPLNPPEYYHHPKTMLCGHSEEDCDGMECGYNLEEVPADYDDWKGENPDD